MPPILQGYGMLGNLLRGLFGEGQRQQERTQDISREEKWLLRNFLERRRQAALARQAQERLARWKALQDQLGFAQRFAGQTALERMRQEGQRWQSPLDIARTQYWRKQAELTQPKPAPPSLEDLVRKEEAIAAARARGRAAGTPPAPTEQPDPMDELRRWAWQRYQQGDRSPDVLMPLGLYQKPEGPPKPIELGRIPYVYGPQATEIAQKFWLESGGVPYKAIRLLMNDPTIPNLLKELARSEILTYANTIKRGGLVVPPPPGATRAELGLESGAWE